MDATYNMLPFIFFVLLAVSSASSLADAQQGIALTSLLFTPTLAAIGVKANQRRLLALDIETEETDVNFDNGSTCGEEGCEERDRLQLSFLKQMYSYDSKLEFGVPCDGFA